MRCDHLVPLMVKLTSVYTHSRRVPERALIVRTAQKIFRTRPGASFRAAHEPPRFSTRNATARAATIGGPRCDRVLVAIGLAVVASRRRTQRHSSPSSPSSPIVDSGANRRQRPSRAALTKEARWKRALVV